MPEKNTKNNNMGKITIALSLDGEKMLRKRAERNMRSISKEVEFLVVQAEKKEGSP